MRKDRKKRSPQPRRIKITSNVLDILVLLAKYRYLRSTFIYGLLPERSVDGCSRTLRRMFDAHLIQKPKSQWLGYNQKEDADIYEIDERGWLQLRRRSLVPYEVTTLTRSKGEGAPKQFDHAMMICDALASIEMGHTAEGLEFIPWGAIRERATTDNPLKMPCRIKTTDTFIVPDGIFGTRYQDGKVWFSALEAENYNPVAPRDLKRASFLKKLHGYNHIAKHKPYRDQLAIPNLRYLFVAPTERKVASMIEAAGKMRDEWSSMPVYERLFFRMIPVQYELMKAPGPFPDLFTDPWETPSGPKFINKQ